MEQKTASTPLISPYASDKKKMDEVLKRMLNTPPKPEKDKNKQSKK